MITLSIFDLKPREALQAARRLRRSHLPSGQALESEESIKNALSCVGGRLSYISRMTKSKMNMEETAKNMVEREKGWLLSQIGLIPDHDDDVMDEVSSHNFRLDITLSIMLMCNVAKMELLLMVALTRIRETASGTAGKVKGKRRGTGCLCPSFDQLRELSFIPHLV